MKERDPDEAWAEGPARLTFYTHPRRRPRMDVTAYIQPELLILIPVLYLVGEGIKRSNTPDEVIPLVNGILGIMLACLYCFATRDGGDVAMVLFTGIVQGILCAAAATYCYELQKNTRRSL